MIFNDAVPYYINDLKNARLAAGYSQGEFAELIGCRREHLCGVETGKVQLSMKMLLKMCDALNFIIRLEKP